MKKTAILIVVILFLLKSSSSFAAIDERVRLVVFPFSNTQLQALDMHLASVLNSELLKYSFIEVIPVEVVRQKLLDIEPALMWTGDEGGVREGGIYWRINSKVVETVHQSGFADYYVYGDYSEFGSQWRIKASISKSSASMPEESFLLHGSSEEEIADKLIELAEKIKLWLNSVYVLNQAENAIRDFMGKLISYDRSVRKIASLVKTKPDLIPLRALLLDLYIKEEANNSKAVDEGLNLINLYNHIKEDDIRYILSLSLDPFEVVARSYEEEGEWSKVIDVRLRALEVFPLNMQVHKNKLGEAYYFSALKSESKGIKEEAYIGFRSAVQYLSPSSKYYDSAVRSFRSSIIK